MLLPPAAPCPAPGHHASSSAARRAATPLLPLPPLPDLPATPLLPHPCCPLHFLPPAAPYTCSPLLQITLIEANELLGSFDARLREYAARNLVKAGVQLLKGVVKQVRETELELQVGAVPCCAARGWAVLCRAVVYCWCGGVGACMLALEGGGLAGHSWCSSN